GSGDAIEISDGALKRLAAQSWPGNLRQLSNTVSRTYAIMLADSLDHSGPPLVTLRHVEQALAMDLARPGTSALQPALDAAARALLAEARRRAPDARETVFHLADAAAALVLHQALSDEGDVKSAYTLLGRDGLVASRSHHKDFRRRMQRLQELYEALGLPIDPALAASMAL
ncbi:MAG: DNA-binding NtrC family response regulator, partial [Myxococcota bacterium]